MPPLRELDLFAGAPTDRVEECVAMLTAVPFARHDVLLDQGGHDNRFLIVLEGEVLVARESEGRSVVIGTGAPGSIFGELSVITGATRRANVSAATDGLAAVGNADAFAVLAAIPQVGERLVDIATQRLAEIEGPVPVELKDGTAAVIRPLLARDREAYASALGRQTEEWRHRRFFSALTPSPALVEYLVHVDYLDHFAWVVADPAGNGMGVGHLIRVRDDPTVAEVAFGVDGACQGQGIATILLGATAAAAAAVGVASLRAEVLYENAPMRAVFRKVGARFQHAESGVVETTFPVDAVRSLVPRQQWDALSAVTERVIEVASLALWQQQVA